MKFKDYVYERPNLEAVKNAFDKLLNEIKNADSAIKQIQLVKDINVIRNTISSMSTIASIRHTMNTADEFYDAEQNYWDENGPLFEELNVNLYKVLLESPYLDELKKEFGEQFFVIASYQLKTFKPEIIEDLVLENKYSTQYSKLIASAKIEFEGEVRNLPGLVPFTLSSNRETRRLANEAKYNFFVEHENEIDDIYDKLVKVRTSIAHKLGYKNFVELGYIRMLRSDYNPEMVEAFRKQVLEYIVPVANKLYDRQNERLNLGEFKYYDEKFEYTSGNATPKGDSNWIIENGIKMYEELSPETKVFFDFMIEHDLLDLVTRANKRGGGYCTYIPDYKSPFIFSNFNGTEGDIDVLTHEAGHAFQVFQSRWIEIPECGFPTYESCEIHSMSMEFFTWPWMNLFFKEDEQKYKYSHLGGAIKFIPYGVTVDAFQHYVYENYNATPAERKQAWRELEKQFLPHKNYDECDFLERGGWWFQQAHIFNSPFYYIDYTLAQICAFQFWVKMHKDSPQAWQDYLNLCSVGGTKSFLSLLEVANLKSPFEDGCVSSVIDDIETWLMSVDDKAL